METRRILLVCDHFPADSTKNVLGQARALARAGHEVVIGASSVGKVGEKLPDVNGSSFRIVRFPSVKVPSFRYTATPFAGRWLLGLFKSFKPDIIHSHFIMYHLSLSSASLAGNGVPLILSLHGFTLPSELGTSVYRIPLMLAYTTMGKRMVQKADHFLCVSDDTRNKFLSVYPTGASRSSVFPIGLDFKYESTLISMSREETRGLLGLDDRVTFIFVGRMSESKGVDKLAKAFAELSQERNDIALLFVGEGKKRKQLMKMYSHIKDMHFIGFRKDVGTFLKASDAFILPSHREGLPTVILEAMYNGLPFIATNVGGIPDIVNLGAKGRLISQPDPDLIKQELAKFADTDLQTLRSWGDKNKQIVEEHFCWDNLVDKLLELYDSCPSQQ